jgi:Kef-type K+ transport system membrane component KefB
LNYLLLIGAAVVTGFIAGKMFERVGVPEVVTLIVLGVLLGESLLGFFSTSFLDLSRPLVDLALAFIGFFIGGELKIDVLRRRGKRVSVILLSEALLTFVLVTSGVYLLTRQLHVSLILGALSTSTAPAATADVLWEYKSEGALTSNIFAIVGLDDAVALTIYAVAGTYAETMFVGEGFSPTSAVIRFIPEIGGALITGGILGLALISLSREFRSKRDSLILAVGFVILCGAIAEYFAFSEILANMVLGLIFTNYCIEEEHEVEHVRDLISPLFILFFILVGARLQIRFLVEIGLIGLTYLAMRILGKTLGASLGARISGSPEVVKKYLGICLFSQAGIAIGLATDISHRLAVYGQEGIRLGIMVVNIITSTTIILNLVGPPLIKLAITRSGEIGRKRLEP